MMIGGNWRCHTVESLCSKVSSGGTPSRSRPEYYDNGTIPWLKTKELHGYYIEDSEEKITEDALSNSSAKLFPPETVLMAMYGDGRTITSLGILRNEAATNQACCAMIADPAKCDPKFLLYTLSASKGRLLKLALGGAQRNLSGKTIKQFEIMVPEVEHQKRIAGILSAYDDLIENNLKRIRILEDMAQSLYREWFVHFRYPGHESVPLVDSPLGLIPEGWELKAVDDCFEITGGGTPSKKIDEYWKGGTVQWYSPRDLTADDTMFMEKSASLITELGLKKSSAKLFPAYSVMLTSRATIGAISINTTPASTNQGFITCLPNEKVSLYFLYHWLKENVETFISHASGATFKEISKGVFRQLNFLLPPETLVLKYEESVSPLANQLLNLQRRNQTLRQTRDLLLPKLIKPDN